VTLPRSAISHYQQQQVVTVETAREVDRLWAGMTDDFDASWATIRQRVFETTAAGQLVAALAGSAYVGRILDETDVDAPAVARVDPQRFIGGTRDGRPLETLLDGAVVKTKEAVGQGIGTVAALGSARDWLHTAVMDSVRDANRQSVGANMTVRPTLQGWVRMMNPPSCKFCISLAGKWFRWNTGFQSHPHCDCRHIPSQESRQDEFTVNPRGYFDTLDEATQNRIFGKADAQAIRDGADISQVVNVRGRGYSPTQLRKAAKRRGWQSDRFGNPPLMTVDEIYAAARNREHAIELLGENGFIASFT
jgi:hypothetical protein